MKDGYLRLCNVVHAADAQKCIEGSSASRVLHGAPSPNRSPAKSTHRECKTLEIVYKCQDLPVAVPCRPPCAQHQQKPCALCCHTRPYPSYPHDARSVETVRRMLQSE